MKQQDTPFGTDPIAHAGGACTVPCPLLLRLRPVQWALGLFSEESGCYSQGCEVLTVSASRVILLGVRGIAKRMKGHKE